MNKFKKKFLKPFHQFKFVFTIAVCLISILGVASSIQGATKDKTKPTLTVKSRTTSYAKKVKLQVTAKDASGIKEVKYAFGTQKTSYFKKSGKKVTLKSGTGTVSVSENGTYTFYAMDKAGNTKLKTITVELVDITPPVINLSSSVLNQVATVSVDCADLEAGIASLSYVDVAAELTDNLWEDATDITGLSNFEVEESGTYTVKATDMAGNESVSQINVQMELRGVWISFLEFSAQGATESDFISKIDAMFDRVVELGMNAVIVQVRMFSDAMYPSKYYPWSRYASGTQGVDPLYDPMKLMIEKAHERGLEFHAWINPYRITTNSIDIMNLADNNPAKKWLTDSSETNDRNVLAFGSNLYYNPASSQVRKLILNGVKEIVQNYEVDGIHFDDYFYPNLGASYETVFDAPEYETYIEKQTAAGKTVKSIVDWRRNNVNTLVKSVYKAIKEIDSSCQFGISPQGNMNNLDSKQANYVDYKTWFEKDGYIDYLCPQLYWSFEHETCAFDDLLSRWLELRADSKVKMYAGIATYRALRDKEPGWEDEEVLANMVICGRETGEVDGYMFFRYDFFQHIACQPAVDELIPILKESP